MQENKAKMSSNKQTFIKEAKNKNVLVTCYKFIYYKPRKLQITSIKVTSLA